MWEVEVLTVGSLARIFRTDVVMLQLQENIAITETVIPP